MASIAQRLKADRIESSSVAACSPCAGVVVHSAVHTRAASCQTTAALQKVNAWIQSTCPFLSATALSNRYQCGECPPARNENA